MSILRTYQFAFILACTSVGCLRANQITVDFSSVADNSPAGGLYHMRVRAADLNVPDLPFLTNSGLFSDPTAEDNLDQSGDRGASAFATAAVEVNTYQVAAGYTPISTYTYSAAPGIPEYPYYPSSSIPDGWVTNSAGMIGNIWNTRIGSNRWPQQQMDLPSLVAPATFSPQNIITVTTVNPGSPLYQRAFWVGPPIGMDFGPEPSTILLMFSGLAAGCIWKLRRRRAR